MTHKLPRQSLEKTLLELEKVVDQMESKELPLDESLKLFEKGIQLTHTAQKMLSEAEQKIEIIQSNNIRGSTEKK